MRSLHRSLTAQANDSTYSDPVWYDHLPFVPFPKSWPQYCPAGKLANWLESYAEAMEINTWMDTNIANAKRDVNGV